MKHLTPKQLKEKLAAVEHERWADWQKWVHKVGQLDYNADGDEVLTIPIDMYHRWERQIKTPYSKLTYNEKISDMQQVDRYWPLVVKFAEQAYQEGVKAAKEGQA